MIRMKFTISNGEWKALNKWTRTFVRNMTGAVIQAQNVLHTQIRLNLSGPSHVLFPGNGNPFPGTITGRMKNSITAPPPVVRAGKITGIVGPNVWYAINHVIGRGVPKRDFLTAAFKTVRREVRRILRRGIKESL